jgi:hypothetical protein
MSRRSNEDPRFVASMDGGKCRYYPHCMIHDGTRQKLGSFGRQLTAEQVRAIRADTRSQSVIAAEYGVTQNFVSAIKLHRSYKWVTE